MTSTITICNPRDQAIIPRSLNLRRIVVSSIYEVEMAVIIQIRNSNIPDGSCLANRRKVMCSKVSISFIVIVLTSCNTNHVYVEMPPGQPMLDIEIINEL